MHLVVDVRLHDGRFHGMGEWAPSPARLFQALVAAAPRGGTIDRSDERALVWLEGLPPPIIATPVLTKGQRIQPFVPNNDIDTVDGDPDRVHKVRTSTKVISPLIFHATVPFLFAWSFEPSDDAQAHLSRLFVLIERIHQLGRGVDMAYANACVLDYDGLGTVLRAHPGPVHRPAGHARAGGLRCPHPGSFRSLEDRHRATLARFVDAGSGAAAITLFAQPPKPSFANVSYDDEPARLVFELQRSDGSFAPWPLHAAAALAEWVRDGVAANLRAAMPDAHERIDLAVVGRKGADARRDGRIRVLPMPSIGHAHVDRSIRRVMIEVPPGCPLRLDDVAWAVSGLELGDPKTGVVRREALVPASEDEMSRHYGIGERYRTWRTITPAALPESAARRRIEPTRRREEAKGSAERIAEESRARRAVVQALRHAGIGDSVERVHVQREPFAGGEERAERFAGCHRFAKERLWNVEITFQAPRAGPLIVGDGRYLGLGLMYPVRTAPAVHAFAIEGDLAIVSPIGICRAFRRAVMARVQAHVARALPTFFTGHEAGDVARGDGSAHIAFQYDPQRRRLLVIAPSVLNRIAPASDERNLAILDRALEQMTQLRAGSAGVLRLKPMRVDDADPLFAHSNRWSALTPYVVNRHPKRTSAAEAVAENVRAECTRRGLRAPHVTVRETRGVPGLGLTAMVDLTFDVPIAGPLILGRTRHLGGGLFGGS